MTDLSSTEIEKEIRNILDGADLATLSSKKVRRLLERTFNADLTSRKKEIDKTLMSELAKREQKEAPVNRVKKEKEIKTEDVKENESIVKNEDEEEEEEESMEAVDGSDSSFETPDDMGPPEPKKAQKSVKQEVIDDEELARRLQAADGRRTRNCNKHKQAPKKPKKNKKDKKEKPKKGPKTGYNSDMVLSAELAEIMGSERMSRAEVVKRMWQIVKERELADPKNKQYHICDDQLLKVFGTKRVRTFSMMKYLKRHIKDPDLLSNS